MPYSFTVRKIALPRGEGVGHPELSFYSNGAPEGGNYRQNARGQILEASRESAPVSSLLQSLSNTRICGGY